MCGEFMGLDTLKTGDLRGVARVVIIRRSR